MDARLLGAEGDPGHRRDLGVVVALDIEEDDRGALVVGDPGEGLVEGAMAFQRSGRNWAGSA